MSIEMKPFSQTYVFDVLNMGKEVTQVVNLSAKEMLTASLTQKEFDLLFLELRLRTQFVGKEIILNALERGELKFIYLPKVRLPFWSLDGKTTYVNLFGYYTKGSPDGNKPAKYIGRQIFALAHAAYTTSYVRSDFNSLAMNAQFVKSVVSLYAKQMAGVLNALYGISADPRDYIVSLNMLGRFALANLLGRGKLDEKDNAMVADIVAGVMVKSHHVTPNMVEEALHDVKDEAFKDLSTFIKELGERLLRNGKKANVNDVIRKAILQYGEKYIYCIENLGMFVAFNSTVLMNGNILKDYIVNGTIDVQRQGAFFTIITQRLAAVEASKR